MREHTHTQTNTHKHAQIRTHTHTQTNTLTQTHARTRTYILHLRYTSVCAKELFFSVCVRVLIFAHFHSFSSASTSALGDNKYSHLYMYM